MTGDQTHQYDLVMELSDQLIKQIIQGIMDGGLAHDIASLVPGVLKDETDKFTVDVKYLAPALNNADGTRFTMPAGTTDYIYVNVTYAGSISLLGFSLVENLKFEMIVGVDFGHCTDILQGLQALRLNLLDKLYYANFYGLCLGQDINIDMKQALKGLKDITGARVDYIPLPVMVPVESAPTTDPLKITAADFSIVVLDPLGSSAIFMTMLTCGGGKPGNRAAFNGSDMPAGNNVAILFGSAYVCRLINDPIKNTLLKGKGDFSKCHLNTPIDNFIGDVRLDLLDIKIVDDAIAVSVGVSKSGTCYHAAGTGSASVKLGVDANKLTVIPKIDAPVVNIEPDVVCVVLSVALGANLVLGITEVLADVAIGFTIDWIIEEAVKGALNDAMSEVTTRLKSFNDAFKTLTANLYVPSIGGMLLGAHIDDVAMAFTYKTSDTAPVWKAGTIQAKDGDYIDLETGAVGDTNLAGADLRIFRTGADHYIETATGAAAAVTGYRNIGDVTRYGLFQHSYQSGFRMKVSDIASRGILAVRTGEGSYAAALVQPAAGGLVNVQYRTYNRLSMYSDSIEGDFTCAGLFNITLPPDRDYSKAQVTMVRSAAIPPAGVRSMLTPVKNTMHLPKGVDFRPGFYGSISQKMCSTWDPQAIFTAAVTSLKIPTHYKWYINGQSPSTDRGRLNAPGTNKGKIIYQLSGRSLYIDIENPDSEVINISLKADVSDDYGHVVHLSRDVVVGSRCKKCKHAPDGRQWIEKSIVDWGIVEATVIETPWAVNGLPEETPEISVKAVNIR